MTEYQPIDLSKIERQPLDEDALRQAEQIQIELNELSQKSHELSIASEQTTDPDEKADLLRQAKEVMEQITQKHKLMRDKFNKLSKHL
jgi:hypothetical protein